MWGLGHFLFLCRQACLGSDYPCAHLNRTAGFLYAALKLVHVLISTAFKCGVCTPSGPLCVRRHEHYVYVRIIRCIDTTPRIASILARMILLVLCLPLHFRSLFHL